MMAAFVVARLAGVYGDPYGRVPLFFYLLHIPLIHLAACIVSVIREGGVNPWLLGNHPMAPGPAPAGYMWSLPLLYLVFAMCVTVLYFPCDGLLGSRRSSGGGG
jgi:hypothetical protein